MMLVWRARALADMRATFAHIARYTSPGHAFEMLSDIRVHLEGLVDNPDMGHRGEHRGERFIIARAGEQTYRCTYRVRGQTIYIVRVIDTRRQQS